MLIIIEKYLPAFIGIGVIAVLVALSEYNIIKFGQTAFENKLVSLFVGIAIANITDLIMRDNRVKKIIHDTLKYDLSDECKLTIFETGDEAYSYLVSHLALATKIYNTIISAGSYDSSGMDSPSKDAKAFHETKLKIIRGSKIAWEDIVSLNNKDYVKWIMDNHYKKNKSKYTAFVLNYDLDVFQNFIIIEYQNGFIEVIIGWIMLYRSVTNVERCYSITNQNLAKHYKQYFSAIRDIKSIPYSEE